MDDQNTDSDSHSVASTQSVSSTSSKQKLGGSHAKETSICALKPLQASGKRKADEDGKVSSTPKRKKTDATDPAGTGATMGTGATTPSSNSARKAAPLSERQQMALALAMSAQESGGASPLQTLSQPSIATDTTPRSAILRKVNRRNEKGESPLHLATIRGDVDAMKRLLNAGAGVNVPDYAGWTALHEACNHGFVNAAKLLLRKGANVNAQGLDNDTPLHDAAINGNPVLVALLLKYGANPNQANSKGQSPLDVSLKDDITKLLRGEIIFKLESDESDHSASSPESLLPKDEETNVPIHLMENVQVPSKPQSETELPHVADQQVNTTQADDSTKPVTEKSAVNIFKDIKEDGQRGTETLSNPLKPTTESRSLSTGFAQGYGVPADHTPYNVVEKSDQIIDNVLSAKATTTEVKDIQASNPDTAENDKEKHTSTLISTSSDVSNDLFVQASIMDSQLLTSLESSSKSARQSLDFKPIRVASPVIREYLSPNETPTTISMVTETSRTDEKQGNVGNTKLGSIPGGNSGTSSQVAKQGNNTVKTVQEKSKTMHMDISYAPDESNASSCTNDEMSASASMVPTPVQDVTTPEPSTEEATQHIPSVVEYVAQKEQEDTNQMFKPIAFTERKPTVEHVKLETKSLSRPVSPAPERLQRTRTGSMNRKRRQTQLSNPSVEPPVQPDGENSKDSTDSHLSSTSTTRASRSRNKQLASNTTHADEEPPPVRETRRKAMLKERAAANSPSADKLVKSGSQKVPPLTIKLSANKSPAATVPAPRDTSAPLAVASGEPFVMLPDKETERANSALAKEQWKDSTSPGAQDSIDKSDSLMASSMQATSAQTSHTASSSSTMSTGTSGVTTRRTLRSHTNRNQGTIGEKLEDHVPPRKSKRMIKTEPAAPVTQIPTLPPPPGPLTIFNPYRLFKNVREQMFKKWERIATIVPRAPAGYPSYMINTKKYLLLKNASTNASKLAIPLLAAPSQLSQPMKNLFNKQEHERYKLRQQHLIEGEKLRLAYEQEIIRVYARGARAAANQEIPLSVCTILKDKEAGTVYHPFNALKDGSSGQSSVEEKIQPEKTSARSHFNNRQLISWLQDSEDKFEKLKDQMLSRHHHEAESLYAVQTMDWEWELKDLGLCDYKAQPTIDMLHVPMVLVNDDADILNSS